MQQPCKSRFVYQLWGNSLWDPNWRTIWGLWNNSIKFRFIMHSYNTHKLIYSVLIFMMLVLQWENKRWQDIVIYMYITEDTYHLTYVSFFSDEGFTNTEHNFQRIQCTRWYCPSWQYGCHIATPLTRSVKIQTGQWSCRQCDTLSMQQLAQMILLFHWIVIMTMGMRSCRRSPACLLRLTMAVLSMWMTLRICQSHCRHLKIILPATVRRKTLKRVMKNMW